MLKKSSSFGEPASGIGDFCADISARLHCPSQGIEEDHAVQGEVPLSFHRAVGESHSSQEGQWSLAGTSGQEPAAYPTGWFTRTYLST